MIPFSGEKTNKPGYEILKRITILGYNYCWYFNIYLEPITISGYNYCWYFNIYLEPITILGYS